MTAGDGRARMREVATLAGVGLSSVSRVLSDHPDVSERMRERVMLAVEELGYEPDLLAQSLRRRKTQTAGFVVGDIANPLLSEIVTGAEAALRRAGYSMLLTNSEGQSALDVSHIGLLLQRRVDGLLLSLSSEDDPEMLAALDGIDVPMVLLDREIPGARASAVLSSHRDGMIAAVRHLLDLGHRRVALILGRPMRFSRERRAAFVEAYAERELPDDYSLFEGVVNEEQARGAARSALAAREPVTAIVAGGNQILAGVVSEVRDRGLRIGEDVSVVSCDTIALTELLDPPIAVVRRDTRALGAEAARLLLRQLELEGAPLREVLLPTEFLPRPSCGPPPAP